MEQITFQGSRPFVRSPSVCTSLKHVSNNDIRPHPLGAIKPTPFQACGGLTIAGRTSRVGLIPGASGL
ncbi:hypothetical protein FKM82_025154 [Ascaphus truei]